MKAALYLVCASVVLHANGKLYIPHRSDVWRSLVGDEANQLLMGKIIGQGETKDEALGEMNLGEDVKEVKVILISV